MEVLMICSKVADKLKRYRTSCAVLPIILGLVLFSEPACAGWKIPFDGGDSRPVIEQGMVNIGSETGAVYAINANTGKTV